MRLAHITDLHVARSPGWGEYNAKRLLGYVNYRLFRSRFYQEQIAKNALEKMMENPPDAVILTGDITQHGLDAEFDAAEALLSVITGNGVPIIAVLGNHDIYGHSNRERLIAFLRRISLDQYPDRRGIYVFEGVELLPLEQGIPTPLFFSRGRQTSGPLQLARELWCKKPSHCMRLVCGHYPVIDSHGGRLLYFRGLREAHKLIEFCRDHSVSGYFCGHNHKRFVTPMPGGCMQYAAPALSSVHGSDSEWVSIYRCGPDLDHPLDEGAGG